MGVSETPDVVLDGQYKQLYEEYGAFTVDNYDNDNTGTRRKAGVKKWLGWCQSEDIDPFEVTESEIHQYIRSVNNLADTSVSSLFSSVSMFYLWIIPEDYPIEENPTADIDLKDHYNLKPQTAEYVKVLRRKGRENVKALPKERITKIFDHMGNPPIRNSLLARLAWQTALRTDEMSRIRIDNIDFGKREIRIRSSKLNPEDHPDLYIRRVYYNSNLDELMKDWINKRRAALSPHASDSPYLFLTHQSKQMRPSHISRLIKDAAHEAGIQEPIGEDGNGNTRWLVTGHRIRHSRISYLANETPMTLPALRKMAGHAKISTTQDYITTDWEQVRKDYLRSTS